MKLATRAADCRLSLNSRARMVVLGGWSNLSMSSRIFGNSDLEAAIRIELMRGKGCKYTVGLVGIAATWVVTPPSCPPPRPPPPPPPPAGPFCCGVAAPGIRNVPVGPRTTCEYMLASW